MHTGRLPFWHKFCPHALPDIANDSQASPTDCSDESWRDIFFGKHEWGTLWLLICHTLEKHLLT